MGMNDKQQSIKNYSDYINQHVANVQKACDEYGEDLCNAIGCDYKELRLEVQHHDSSKFNAAEFNQYRKKFYPANGEESNEDEFNEAWLHHIHNNCHHPEYWCLVKKDGYEPLPMDPVSIVHMICDWQSFSYIGKGNAYDFYYKVDNKAGLLHEESRVLLERALDKLKEKMDEKI